VTSRLTERPHNIHSTIPIHSLQCHNQTWTITPQQSAQFTATVII